MKTIQNAMMVSGTLVLCAVLLCPGTAVSQDRRAELKSKLEEIAAAAYQSASSRFPCEVKTRGKPRMMRWEGVDKCLNEAVDRVDWAALSSRIAALRRDEGANGAVDFDAELEAALSAHAFSYDKVFKVKNPETLLPLTHSVLKFLPADSLADVTVYDKQGTRVGTFAGTYVYERTGGLATANTYRLSRFQYRDSSGNIQSAHEQLLLDSFGVPWKEVSASPGFRLSSDKLKQ
jgi:hypothetical protein